jgi:hypothetical protein
MLRQLIKAFPDKKYAIRLAKGLKMNVDKKYIDIPDDMVKEFDKKYQTLMDLKFKGLKLKKKIKERSRIDGKSI